MASIQNWWAELRKASFHKQMTATLVLGTLCVALLSSLAISWFVTKRLHANFLHQGLRVVETFAQQSTLSLIYGAPENAERAIAATIAFPDVSAVAIVDARGRTLVERSAPRLTGASEPNFASAPAPQPDASQVEHESTLAWSLVAPVIAGAAGEDSESPLVVAPTKPERLGFVRVVLSKRTLNSMSRDIFLTNGAISLICAAALLLLLNRLTRRMTLPLRALSDTMQSADRGVQRLRADVRGPQEIAAMGGAFNNMMEVLEERERELMVARDQALESARVKAEFATSVSHEIRTPMNGVLGMLEILRDTQMSREQHDYVSVARTSAQALLGLINNILDFAKGEAGKIELEHVSFDLRELVEEALYLVVGPAQQKYLELGYTIAADVPLQVSGDPGRLRQVLVNLLGNAVKFTEMGEVALRVSRGGKAGELRFEVRDTGIGIDEQHHQHIFRSFSQVDGSTTRKYGGSGLGLTICKQIVEFMGGEIGVRSQLGHGSTFWFQVPLQGSAGEVGAVASEFAGMRAKVLILGASGITTEFLRLCLNQWQIDCEHVLGEEFALQKLRDAAERGTPFGLVIVDDLALATGLAPFTKQLQAEHATRNVRLAVVSRFIEPGRSAAMYDANVVARLRKPLRYADVRECLARALLPSEEATAGHRHGERGAGHTPTALVVEDNKTNQIVAQGFLVRLGFAVSLAKDGQEGVRMAQRERFDVILMDCNMPVMDGYEATARIRALPTKEASPVPILAMTANSKASDLQRCRTAGMDDVLVKPLSLERMKQALERWVVPPAGADAAAGAMAAPAAQEHPPAAPTAASPAIDAKVASQLREALGSGVSAMIDAFLSDTPEYVAQLRDALKVNNDAALRQVAHVVKGSSANIGAVTLADIAAKLEDSVDAADRAQLQQLVDALAHEFERVATSLNERTQSMPARAPAKSKDGLVLVVDDDRSTRTALRHALEVDGFVVEEAINGQQALAALNRANPDLVLLDAVMPVMDGFATATEIRQRAAYTPIVMITALDDSEAVDRAFAAGATDYIPKPIHFGVLTQRVRRIVEAMRSERHIRHMAYHDALTGLPNRLSFLEHLNRQVAHSNRQGRSVAVLFLDLDRFKVINDSLGHDIGDGLLKAVAQRIVHSVRGEDLVARLGGDEFVVVLDDLANSKVAAAVAEKIALSLEAPFFIGGHEIFVRASVGISICPLHATDAGTLLKHADTAMYRAKRSGGGYAYYEEAMGESFTRRMWLETGLRKAIERGELFLCYQPMRQVKTGKVRGVEALLRWRHATEGLILPNEFIPIAEDNGLIGALGDWVLRHACEQVQRWRAMQLADYSIAVNVSARQLLRGDYVDTVARVLRETGIDPAMVALELTESAIMERAEDSLQSLAKLRDLGLRLVVDDFGTGYSSFAYLKQLPLHALKIDGSFTRDVAHDQNAASIVAGIIALAHSLGLEVVAEGVETAQHLSMLQQHECDLAQGFLLGAPLVVTEFEQQVLGRGAGSNLKLVS